MEFSVCYHDLLSEQYGHDLYFGNSGGISDTLFYLRRSSTSGIFLEHYVIPENSLLGSTYHAYWEDGTDRIFFVSGSEKMSGGDFWTGRMAGVYSISHLSLIPIGSAHIARGSSNLS